MAFFKDNPEEATSISSAGAFATQAEAEADYAQEWATKPVDQLISAAAGGNQSTDYSALHHAAKAQEGLAASEFAQEAAGHAATAAARAAEAAGYRNEAQTAASNAADALAPCLVAVTDAETAQTAAEAAQTAAEAAETNAAAEVVLAQAEVTYASEWATEVEDTLISAPAGGNQTTDYSALHHAAKAATSASNASTSASNASTSETNAATSETNAGTSETNAAASLAAIGDELLYAEEWATKAEDSLISVAAGGDGVTDYSSYHWAQKALAAAAPSLGLFTGLTDVTITAAANNQVVQYDSGSGEWVNRTLSQAGILASTTALESFSGLTFSTDKLPYVSTTNTFATTEFSALARTLLASPLVTGMRTTLDVDKSGTDNSTPVTFVGTLDYISLSGQEITVTAVDLATDVTGTLPVANGGTGGATASAARTALGLAIGSDVEAYNSALAATTASYTTAEESKLAGIEPAATADQSDAEIETAYHNQVPVLAQGGIDDPVGTSTIRLTEAWLKAFVDQHGGATGAFEEFTADSLVVDGDVLILRGDGKVETLKSNSDVSPAGTLVEASAGPTSVPNLFINPVGRSVVAWRNSAGETAYRVFTVPGSMVPSFAAATQSTATPAPSGVVIPVYHYEDGRWVFVFGDANNSNRISAVTATESAGVMTFGTIVQIDTATSMGEVGVEWDINAERVLVTYKDASNEAVVRVLDSNAGTITLGTPLSLDNTVVPSQRIQLVYHPGIGKCVVAHLRVVSTFDVVTAATLTIDTGTNVITAGSRYDASSGFDVTDYHLGYDHNSNTLLVAYPNDAKAGYVDGSEITWGPAAGIGGSPDFIGFCRSDISASVITDDTTDISARSLTVEPGALIISYGTPVVIADSANVQKLSLKFNPTTMGAVYAYEDTAGGDEDIMASGYIIPATNFKSYSTFGIAQDGGPSGTLVSVSFTGAIDDAQSGLFAGANYYIDSSTGALTTSSSGNFPIGRALSSTKLLLT